MYLLRYLVFVSFQITVIAPLPSISPKGSHLPHGFWQKLNENFSGCLTSSGQMKPTLCCMKMAVHIKSYWGEVESLWVLDEATVFFLCDSLVSFTDGWSFCLWKTFQPDPVSGWKNVYSYCRTIPYIFAWTPCACIKRKRCIVCSKFNAWWWPDPRCKLWRCCSWILLEKPSDKLRLYNHMELPFTWAQVIVFFSFLL